MCGRECVVCVCVWWGCTRH
uniref:Uncharacterized protein n=1 Tax=Anguilla anguilla TaxID=7936 RepID=A0A0E9UXG8_ANGAN